MGYRVQEGGGMSATRIEWCDLTINPIIGCGHCSPGCDHCYAERFAARLAKNPKTADRYFYAVDAAGKWSGRISYAKWLVQPIFFGMNEFERLPKTPKRVFVGSMTDMFHDRINERYLEHVISECEILPQHTFCFLTKRPHNVLSFLSWAEENTGRVKFMDNILVGVTVCNQIEADEKIPLLLQVPAARRFVSVEPMLGPVDLDAVSFTHSALDWVICGAEQGPGKRLMKNEWALSLYNQCNNARIPFFFKKASDKSPILGDKIIRQFPDFGTRKCTNKRKAQNEF
jgi:protein gp37